MVGDYEMMEEDFIDWGDDGMSLGCEAPVDIDALGHAEDVYLSSVGAP
jgi:hypothetical protein